MKKFLATLVLLGCLSVPSFALYKGVDEAIYKGSNCIHFTVTVTSSTITPAFSSTSYSSVFTYTTDMEFTVAGSSPVYVGSASSFIPSSSAACRKMAVGETFRVNGRNNASIYIKTLDGTTDTAIITGTIWGY